MPNESRCKIAAGGYGNMVLYRMCADEPSHEDSDIVESKARMIAKVYEVNRNLGQNYGVIVKVLCSKKLGLDDLLSKLEHETLSETTIGRIVRIHADLDKLLCKSLSVPDSARAVRSRASFVSKYLHFHQPDAFPILDSLAERGMKKILNGRLPWAVNSDNAASDRYERFCRAILALRERPEFSTGSLRAIDSVLFKKGRKIRDKAQRSKQAA